MDTPVGALMMDAQTFIEGAQRRNVGRTKFFRIAFSTNVVWVPGHVAVTGFYLNGTNISATKDGSTWSQLQTGVNAQIDTVVFFVDNTTERNFGFMNTEILPGEQITITNQGAGDAWVLVFYTQFPV